MPSADASLRQNLEKKTIPSLNGLRGISALSVAVAHATGLPRWIPADYAVVLFFEISGLLITWLLLSEQDRTGSVDRFSFMKRRTLRLFPAFYACWALCWLVPGVPGRWWSFAYLMDCYNAWFAQPGTPVDVLGMAWSLGIEEKYYLIWPTVMTRFSRQSLLKAMLVLFAVVQVYHFGLYKLGYVGWASWSFDTRIDAILLGSALAIAIKSGWLPPKLWLSPWSLWSSLLLVVLLSGVTWVHRLSLGVLIAVYPLAVILMSVIARPPRILNNSVASFFGKISYSLYLFNPLTVYLVGRISWLHGVARMLVSLVGAILAAILSYYLIERPFLRIKDRSHGASHPKPAVVEAT
jgi:peptidoglycan/LPS O-acetylase OafA/YrhL